MARADVGFARQVDLLLVASFPVPANVA